jgi:hypothetical protein
LQKEAKQRGEKLPGSKRSNKRGNQQPDKGSNIETIEDYDSGCYMCFALGRSNWKFHDAERCWKKKQFTEKLQDDEHRDTMLKKLRTKSKSAREDKASDRASAQSNPSRGPRNERQAQVPQGQIPNVQQMQQAQQMHPQMYNRDPFSQQHMSPQYSGEQVYPWQLQGMQNSVQSGSGLYNSGQFFQSPGQQNATRNAHVSQTMMQGSAGESPQMHFFDHRNVQNPMVLQVSPQSQIFRQTDMRQMPAASDQGMLSMGVQGGSSIQQGDRFSGAESSTANTAVLKPRGAELLAPFLGNYLTTSQQSQSNAMNAIVINPQNSYQAMTGTIVSISAQAVVSDYEHVFTIATKTFHMLPLWILQRMANAKIEQDITSTSSLLQSIVESASDVLHHRIEDGEELIHDVLKGVVGRVDGQGQCFIDTRNFLNQVEECSKVSQDFSGIIWMGNCQYVNTV